MAYTQENPRWSIAATFHEVPPDGAPKNNEGCMILSLGMVVSSRTKTRSGGSYLALLESQ